MAAQLQRSLTSISQSWPKDYLRPALQFSGAILAASSRILNTPPPASAALPSSPSASTSTLPPAAGPTLTSTAGEVVGGTAALSEVQLRKAAQMVASLENLLGDKARKAYPITKKTLEPVSFPKHYTRLMAGVEAAKRGDMERPGFFSFIRWK